MVCLIITLEAAKELRVIGYENPCGLLDERFLGVHCTSTALCCTSIRELSSRPDHGPDQWMQPRMRPRASAALPVLSACELELLDVDRHLTFAILLKEPGTGLEL